MSAITIQDVVDVAPELEAFSQTVDGARIINTAITTAEAAVDEEVWGARYTQGLALYAAHTVLANRPNLGGLLSGGGIVTNKTVGSASESYAAGKVPMGPNSFTHPGALYDAALLTLNPSFLYSA